MNPSLLTRFAFLAAFAGAAVSVHAQSPGFGFGRPATPPAATLGRSVPLGSDHAIRLPAGWNAEASDDGVMLLPPGASFDPGRDDNPEVYLVATRDDYDPRSEAQVVRQMSAAMTQQGGSGGVRQPATFGTRQGAVYRWNVGHQRSGQPLAFYVYLAARESHAIVLIAIGSQTQVRARDAALRQILSNVTTPASTAPAETGAMSATDALADSTPLAQRWLRKLRGQTVRQFWASQGMSSDKKHWFNADGSYRFWSASMVSISVPGAGALGTDGDDVRGRWQIREQAGQVFVEVRYANGQVRRMRITEDNRNWYLNGEKAFVTD